MHWGPIYREGCVSRCRRPAAGGTLNLYTWPNYFAAKNLADFKKGHGHQDKSDFSRVQQLALCEVELPGRSELRHRHPEPVLGRCRGGAQASSEARQEAYPVLVHRQEAAGQDAKARQRLCHSQGLRHDRRDLGSKVVGGQIKSWQDYLDAGAKPGVSGKVDLTDVPDETLGIALVGGREELQHQ